MIRLSYLVTATLWCSLAFSQKQTKAIDSFGEFARQQDSIFISLYEKRDIKNYTHRFAGKKGED